MTALSTAQQAALAALVRAGRIEVVPQDHARARSFLDQAAERISQLPLLTSPAVKYGIAYDACHDIGEALLAAYGYRTRGGAGQHEALGRALRAIIDSARGRSRCAVRPPSTGTQPGPLRGQTSRVSGRHQGRGGRRAPPR